MNVRLRTVMLISFGVVFVGHLLLSFADTSASVVVAHDGEGLTRTFSRQLQGIPNTFLQEARDADARNRLENIQAVEMVRADESAKHPPRVDSAERDDGGSSASDCDMNEGELGSGRDFDEVDEGDKIDDQQLEYASRMGFGQEDEEEEYEEETLQNSIRFESGTHNDDDGTGSTIFSSGSFAGMHSVRLIYPGDMFDGIFENGTYRLGGSLGGKLRVDFEADVYDDDDEEYEDDDDDSVYDEDRVNDEDGDGEYDDDDDTVESDQNDGGGSVE